MAIMWPQKIPLEIRRNSLRAAECRVFDNLQSVLDDKWVVFYSRPWLGLSAFGEEIDGEADFIIAHEDKGFISIEVKGGGISYDPKTEEWTSKDRHGVSMPIKNPFEQAKKSKYRILKLLQDSPHWKPRRIRIRHGVIFPDTQAANRDYGPDKPRALICDRQETETGLKNWLEQRFSVQDAEHDTGRLESLGADGVRALQKTLAEPFHLTVPLAHILQDDDREIHLLTVQQCRSLSQIREFDRIAIRGAAGTGKTILAMEVAARDAALGKKALLTCFSDPLAAHFSDKLGARLKVSSFHALCREAADAANIPIENNVSNSELYDKILPEALFEAAEQLPDFKFDTIVVDEGQDFRTEWWTSLSSVLKPDGRLVIFYDSNQKLYGDIRKLPKDVNASTYPLDRNLRNTDPIHNLTMTLYDGEYVYPNGVKGTKVETVVGATPDTISKKVCELVQRLVNVEKVAPHEIALLLRNESERDAFIRDLNAKHIATSLCDRILQGNVIVESVRRFKGFDCQVAIVVLSDEFLLDKELSYVAFSRARTHLILVGSPQVHTVLSQVFEKNQSSPPIA